MSPRLSRVDVAQAIHDRDLDPPGPAYTTDQAASLYEGSHRFVDDMLGALDVAFADESVPVSLMAALISWYRSETSYLEAVDAIANGERDPR